MSPKTWQEELKELEERHDHKTKRFDTSQKIRYGYESILWVFVFI